MPTIVGKIPECGKADVTVSYDDEARSAGFCRRENDTTIELKEKAEYFKALGMALFDNTIPDTQTPHLARLLEHPITLTIEERLLLKLCYQESFTVTEAGKKLGLNRFQAHGRLKRALQKIKKQFQDAGYEKELKLFLQSS